VSLIETQQYWGRPTIDWSEISEGIRRYGIRNAAQTTVAPTGTIATVAGCEGYGCEPVFALAYIRHVNDNGKDLKLTYTSPAFEQALLEAGVSEMDRQDIYDQVMKDGSCQHIKSVPEMVKNTFVVSADISAEEHVRMQAALQAFVDNSLSKTINFPENATEEDVATAYLRAWELNCKGITVYVTGSREEVVLETNATASKKAPAADDAMPDQIKLWQESKKPRPRSLIGRTFSIETPLGKAFITINENDAAQPFEVFINTAKAGSDTAAVSEAIGRLISYVLRLASPIEPSQRLTDLTRQLLGIGGGRSLGFGPNRVRSLPDGVAQVLEEYLDERAIRLGKADGKPGVVQQYLINDITDLTPPVEEPPASPPVVQRIGDLCPECGVAAVINEEGCRKCYACGYSEC
jgi:ribonucleoside-diphosphate reductase alpha chain